MGNIRPTYIKTIAKDLIEQFPDQFMPDNFQHNKDKVAELTNGASKLLRNRIAGYITRYLVASKKGKKHQPISE
ncbi:MAG: 30S ribosomal protein S17e [Candidatus Thermoplasmatota archaeon]|nr:30S ribosomal protein S17e [Candidatus Thermoplasmatota archaeon]